MSENYVTESYLRRGIEQKAFEEICAILTDLCFDGKSSVDMNDWDSDGKIYGLVQRHEDHEMHQRFIFTIKNRFYRSGGYVHRDDPKDVSQGTGTTGQYTTIRNGGENPIEHDIDKSVTLEHQQSSELHVGITLDLTAKETASYAGVGAELEQHLGITVDKTEAESSSSTTTTSFSDKVTVSPGEEVAIVYSKSSKHFTQDFTVNALSDCAFELEIIDWGFYSGPHADKLFNSANHALWDWVSNKSRDRSARGNWVTHFDSIHDFMGFIHGFDVRAPYMKFYGGKTKDVWGSGAKAAGAVLEKADILRLILSGTDDMLVEGDADYSVMDIKGMSDEEVDEKYGKAGNPIST